MPINHLRSIFSQALPAGIVFVLLGGGLLYQHGEIVKLNNSVGDLEANLNTASSTLLQKVTDLRQETTKTLSSTQQNIDAVKSQVGGVEQTVGSISGTVGTLKKLAEVDPQILKKYSKVYFLNENYTPEHLVTIPSEYLYNEARKEQFLAESWPFLQNLFDTAKASGVTIYVKSGYRSFNEQESLKNAYTVIYGAGTANTFSADQGYSEHQLGTTLDFITIGQGGNLAGFDKTPAYDWLVKNAYNYGFVLSYPKNNNYYIYEPWHWRFVGIKLATYLHDTNQNFYDLDQRVIDKYLVNVFD